MNALTAFTVWFPHRAGSLGFAAQLLDSIGRWTKSGKNVSEIAEVRYLASRYMKSDPGYAADLLEAADRHESLVANEVQK